LKLYSLYHTTLLTCWGGDLWHLQKAWPQMVCSHFLMCIWSFEQSLGLFICIWDKSEIRFWDFKLLLVNLALPSLTKTLTLQVYLLCEGPNLINSPIAFLSLPCSHCFFSSITIFSFFLKNAPCMNMLFSHLFWWLYFNLLLFSHLRFDFCIVLFSIVVFQTFINLWFYYYYFRLFRVKFLKSCYQKWKFITLLTNYLSILARFIDL
jgi:hypothetical protein